MRKQDRYIKDVKESLQAALKILEANPEGEMQSFIDAARQAQHAAFRLGQLTGMLEMQRDGDPKLPAPVPKKIGKPS